GAVDHVADRDLVGVPLLAVAPVLRRDLEALEAGRLALLEAAELLLLGHREPELADDEAVARQVLLEVVDLRVGAHPVGLAGEALEALEEDAAVQGAVEEGEAAAPRHVAPEAPEVGLGALLLGGRGDGDDGVEARVERRGDAADGAALPRRV